MAYTITTVRRNNKKEQARVFAPSTKVSGYSFDDMYGESRGDCAAKYAKEAYEQNRDAKLYKIVDERGTRYMVYVHSNCTYDLIPQGTTVDGGDK